MANTNGSQSLTKSMNGLIELEDGGGTVLSDGIVTTNKVITNNIQGQSATDAITLYTDTTTGLVTLKNIILGTNTITSTTPLLPFNLFTNQLTTANVIIGGSLTRVFVSSFRFRDNLMTVETPTTLVNLFTTQSGTGSITIGNSGVKVRTSGSIFENDTLNLLTPSNTASLFTTQTGSINIGNAAISTNIGNFRFTNNVITSTSTDLITLFPDNLSNLVIGNIYRLVQVSQFVFSNSTIFLPSLTGLIQLFVNHVENIILGNRFININIGSFNFSNKKITTTTPTELLTLFDTQTGGITMGNSSGAFTLNSSTTAINATTSATVTSPTTAIIATTSATITSPTTNINATTTTISSPTTAIDATTSATITSPLTNIVAATKVDMNTPNLNIKNAGNFFELTVDANATRIDFHSNPLFTTDFDARISGAGGTATAGGGSLNLLASNVLLTASTKVDISVPSGTVDINTITLNVKNGLNFLEMSSGNNLALIDFHSNSSFVTDHDSRIISTGGTASSAGGTLALQAANLFLGLTSTIIHLSNKLFRYALPTTYVPTLSNGTCPTRRGSFYITGSMMTVHITYNTIGGGGAAGNGIYGFSIPTGFTIRTVAYNTTPTNGEVQLYDPATGTSGDMSGTSIGNGYIQLRGISMATTCIVPFTNAILAAYGSSQTQGNTNWHGSTYYQFGAPNIVGSFTATFPIN